MAFYFATQGVGSVALTVTANAVRLVASAAFALIAVYVFDLGAIGFFVSVAIGFVLYAALTVCAIVRLRSGPVAPKLEPLARRESKEELSRASTPPIYSASS
jgi:hypothetical protein